MPVKNNFLIYENIHRSAVMQYGVWDQIRVDHGTEFYLSLYILEKLSTYRKNPRRAPFIQTTSKQVCCMVSYATLPEVFGVDLLTGNQELQELCDDNFKAIYPSFDGFFHSLVNGNHYPFQQELLIFIDQTTALPVSPN